MPVIQLETTIAAPVETVFDMTRDVGAHCETVAGTRERAVAGRTSGLLAMGETVTWEAVHFGVRQRLTSKIVEMDRPQRFVDEMQRGAFQRLRHTHDFSESSNSTIMRDTLDFASPLGILGALVDRLVLERYMTAFLKRRNAVLKAMAEASQARKPAPP